MSDLAAQVHAIHDGLEEANVPHAFGGAIALAYCTLEPRGTRDIDVNVFVATSEVERVFSALPTDIPAGPADRLAIERDGQVRVFWAETPVDLFFDVHGFHRQLPLGVRTVPLAGRTIPVLGCTDLAVFKAMFNRTKDWADVEAMVEAGAIDATSALGWVVRLLGAEHPATVRLAGLLR